MNPRNVLFVVLALCPVIAGAADDGRTQYPAGLANSYFDFGVGYVDHPFSQNLLERGYGGATITRPPVGARLAFGHSFTKHFAVQIVYARPIKWVRYEDVLDSRGVRSGHSVLTNMAGLVARETVPLGGSPFAAYAEAGLGIVTRSGFTVDGDTAAREANYATYLLGGGLTYRLSHAWDLRTGLDYTPGKASINQPHTLVFSGGAVLSLRPRSVERVAADAKSGAIFKHNLLQFAHATNELGTGVNHFFSGGKIPIFWGGSAEVSRGVTIRYQRNVFHTAKVFSLDVGASVGNWYTDKQGTNFWTFSAYPQFRFTLLRTKPADFYAYYSLAGPTYISRSGLDGKDTARKFTFQDLMGVGFYADTDRHFNLEVGIGHFSNGNLTAQNSGVKVPLTVAFGYAF